jgi:ATP-dependent protease HslVU (ClpYQ) peptidase subunit
MTCIIGYVDDDGSVIIGGDSAGIDGLDYTLRKDSKVFQNASMIFGYTSSFRMGQLLRFNLVVPGHPAGMDDYEYMCTKFIDAVIDCFKENGYASIKENSVSGGVFLVGYRKRLYQIDSDFQVGESLDSFNACGCGEDYAKGAMRILTENKELLEFSGHGMVLSALKSVESFCAGVKGPFNMVKI